MSVIPVFIPHAGCPHACVFCNQRSIAGVGAPPRASEVAGILEKGLGRLPSGCGAQAAFYGGSFTALPREYRLELLRAVSPFIKDGRVSSVRLSTRPDCISPEILDELREYSVSTVELGAQSMDDRVLALSGRGHTAQDTVNASKLVKEYGFKLILQMMCGLPGEDKRGAEETARRLVSLKPDGARIYPVVVVSGTELEAMWRAGTYAALTVDGAAELCARLLEIFGEAGIPVIRVGLNPTEELSGGAALAGAYHPAFGALAREKLYYKRAAAALSGLEGAKEATLLAHPSCVSFVAGQHGQNRRALMEAFHIRRLHIRPADVEPGSVSALRDF